MFWHYRYVSFRRLFWIKLTNYQFKIFYNSSNRIANYISNLEIIKSIIDEQLDLPIFIVGDFNTDLNLDKRYSKYLAKFIQESKLKCVEYEFPNIGYTYKNGNYKNHIDHVLANDLARNKTFECKIIEESQNMSDHNAIRTSFWIDMNAKSKVCNKKAIIFTDFHGKKRGLSRRFNKLLEIN
jgi:hypothetical protein